MVVELQQGGSDLIVLPHPQRVHRRQSQLLVGPVVPSLETRYVALGGLDLAVHVSQGGVIKGQKTVAPRRQWAHSQQAAVTSQLSQVGRIVQGVAVDVGCVDERGEDVQLLSWGHLNQDSK